MAGSGALAAASSSLADETVQVCGSYAQQRLRSSTVPGITTTGRCPAPSYNGGGFGLFNSGHDDQRAERTVADHAPPGLELVGATANQLVSAGVNDGGDYGGGFYWAGGGMGTNDQSPSTMGMVVPIALELLRDAARLRQEHMHAARARSLSEHSRSTFVRRAARALARAKRAVADIGMDQRHWPFVAMGQLAVRPVLAVRESERAADQRDHVGAGRLDLASVRGAADQSAGGHDPVWAGRGAADA